jgi:probable rRNA maturation factor
VNIIIENLQDKIPINSKKIKEVVIGVLALERIRKKGEITLCFVDDKRIRRLNLKYLDKNSPTDVLAFDIASPKDSNIFADIVISTDRAIANAKSFRTAAMYELYLYVIHGLLHLLGYDDKNKKDILIMQKREESLLRSLNVHP